MRKSKKWIKEFRLVLGLIITLLMIDVKAWASSEILSSYNWHLLSPNEMEIKAEETNKITLGMEDTEQNSTVEMTEITIEIEGAYFVVDPFSGKIDFKVYNQLIDFPKCMQTNKESLKGSKLASKLCLEVDERIVDNNNIIDQLPIYRTSNQKGDIILTFNQNKKTQLIIKVKEKLELGEVSNTVNIEQAEKTHDSVYIQEKVSGALNKGVIELAISEELLNWWKGIQILEGDIKVIVWEQGARKAGKVWIEVVETSTVPSKIRLFIEKTCLVEPLSTSSPFKTMDLLITSQVFSNTGVSAKYCLKDYLSILPSKQVTAGAADRAIYFKAGSEGYIVGEEYYPIQGSIYMKDQYLMAPIRSIIESTGIAHYNLTYNKGEITLTVGKEETIRKITLQLGEKDVIVDNQTYTMQTAPELKAGILHVPVSEIATLLELEVSSYRRGTGIVLGAEEQEKSKEIKIVTEGQRLKAGLRRQNAGTVYIKEGTNERFKKGVLEIFIGDGGVNEKHQSYILQAIPEVSVIKGDLKIKLIGVSQEKANTYVIEIIEQSTLPSAIAVSYPDVALDRTTPERDYGFKLSGVALDNREIAVKDFFEVRTPNTCE